MIEAPLLEMRGITMDFPGVRALDSVDFTLRSGEIHCLMGENGAGKSTLIRVLTGVYKRTQGKIHLNGADADPTSPKEALRLGVSTVYQEVNLIPRLSAAENLFLGRMPWRMGFLRRREMNRRAREAIRSLNVDMDVTRPVGEMSIALQQMVAIARALDVSARVLVLDEPTSSLDASEVESLFAVLRRLRDEGLGIVFITHFLEQVYKISDRITILRNGRLVGTHETSGLSRLDLVSRMIGRDARELEDHATAAKTKHEDISPILKTDGIGRKASVQGVSLSVRPGEVVGLAGLLGSGRTEVLRLLFGIDRKDEGKVTIAGRTVVLRSPAQAVSRKIGFCSEDRRAEGIIPELSVRENMMLVMQGRRGWMRRIPGQRQRQIAEQYVKSLNIATSDIEKPIAQLSGGNQQKVLLARWLVAEPDVLLLDEPTRGIDVGARFEIEKLIESLRQRGLAVVLVSSELDELVRSCQRVFVMRDLRCVDELKAERVTEPSIMRSIAGEAA